MTITRSESATGNTGTPATRPDAAPKRPSRSLVRRHPTLIVSPLIALIALGVWVSAIEVFGVEPLILPAPLDVLDELWLMLTGTELYRNLLVTVTEFGIGFALGSTAAIIVAAILVRLPVLEKGFSPYIIAFQNFPKIAIAPMLVTWFGFGMAPKVALATVLAFFPVFVNVIVGLKSFTREQRDLMRMLQASEWQTFWMLRVKVALPYIFAGLRVAAVFSLLGAITGEFISSSQGLGYMLLQRNAQLQVDGVFALLIVMATIGLAVHGILAFLNRKIIFWEDHDQAKRPAQEESV
ncbi:ABC transporter permease [Micromonospora craniellae]|uniref:ABC transporter permease n=1 Tax=Micromonospora craniellae TaxID=2294034 RepID=A0A372G3T0_9ACTN|nr:ABC transporter permease [Micromonospora craniellae]QOC92124.1 ABC transporter permease [Micromonospora craniellae]RFS47419.1 ABC transporter permease [Micromonospora craniellae]